MNENLKKHIISFLDKDLRMDGRKPLEYRDVKVEYGISKTAEGSARVTIGGTIVIAGVKMGVERPYSDRPEEGMLMVNVELVPLSNPEFELGPPSERAIELARVVDRGIRESKAVDTSKLCIEKGEKAWSVGIDIVPMNDEGKPFDASAIAAMAALKDAKIPTYKDDVVDYKKLTDKKLPIQKEPISITVLKVGGKLIVDPTINEELVADARLTVASADGKKICALQKGGIVPLTSEEIDQMLQIGLDNVKALKTKL